MDSVDIVSIIIAIAAYVFFTVRKYKKKEAEAAQRRKRVQPSDIFEEPEVTEPIFETVRPPRSHPSAPPPEQNVPKTDEYFTYEDVNPSVEPEVSKSPPSMSNTPIQTTDIEAENETNSLPLKEEIDKAIIYSEILKRPYN